jgi:hypothetical protein
MIQTDDDLVHMTFELSSEMWAARGELPDERYFNKTEQELREIDARELLFFAAEEGNVTMLMEAIAMVPSLVDAWRLFPCDRLTLCVILVADLLSFPGQGADVNARDTEYYNQTALHFACQFMVNTSI